MPPRIIVRRDGLSVSSAASSTEEPSIQLSGSTVVEVFDDAVVITFEQAEEPASE